jgi:hypothetical protein
VYAPEETAPPKLSGTTPRPVPARAVAPEIDVDNLVDKVERKLIRRIVAERQRRGGLG